MAERKAWQEAARKKRRERERQNQLDEVVVAERELLARATELKAQAEKKAAREARKAAALRGPAPSPRAPPVAALDAAADAAAADAVRIRLTPLGAPNARGWVVRAAVAAGSPRRLAPLGPRTLPAALRSVPTLSPRRPQPKCTCRLPPLLIGGGLVTTTTTASAASLASAATSAAARAARADDPPVAVPVRQVVGRPLLRIDPPRERHRSAARRRRGARCGARGGRRARRAGLEKRAAERSPRAPPGGGGKKARGRSAQYRASMRRSLAALGGVGFASERDRAAAKLQDCWVRKLRAKRAALARRDRAALSLQNAWRAKTARRYALSVLLERQKRWDAAATTVQRHARGNAARAAVDILAMQKAQKYAHIDATLESFEAMRVALLDDSAAAIQSAWRTNFNSDRNRERRLRRTLAVMLLQRQWRGTIARRKVALKRKKSRMARRRSTRRPGGYVPRAPIAAAPAAAAPKVRQSISFA